MARRALLRLWRLRHALPLTPLGAGLVALALWVGHGVGARQADYVLTTGGLAALLAVGLAGVLVALATLRLWLHLRRLHGRQADPLRLESGLAATTGLHLPALRGWPLVRLRLFWEEPALMQVALAERPGVIEEIVTPLCRGQVARHRRRVLVEDVFGFCRLGLPLRTEQQLRVDPARARVTAHVVTRFCAGDALSHPDGSIDGDPIEMRRYVYGDPLRHVLWKAFARTRKLLVRTPERAVTPQRSGAAYLVAGEGDEPAASAARFFIEQGLLGQDFTFAADGADAPTSDAQQALDQIVASVRSRHAGGEGLARFLRQLGPRQIEALVLFVPAEPGAWLPRLEALAPRLRGVRAITAVDDAPQMTSRRRPSLRHLIFAPPSVARLHARHLGRVVGRLSRAGLAVHVIHRPTGGLLGRAVLDALSEMEARA